MYLKYVFIALACLVLNACGKETGNTDKDGKAQKPDLEDLNDEPRQEITAQKLWARLSALDLSQAEGMAQAQQELKELSASEEGERIIRELLTFKDQGSGLIHKVLKAPVNQDSVTAVTALLQSLPDDEAKKALLEQKDKGADALALLLLRGSQQDDEALLDSLTEKVIGFNVDTKPAVEKMWQAIRPARFAVNDPARAHALAVLKRFSRLHAQKLPKEISRALTTKSDMAGTNSGLLQSLVQGPIDAEVYRVIKKLIEDQADAAAKKSFVEQKLGSLFEPAIYYLKNLNVSGMGNISAGIRLSPLAAVEDPYLGALIALFLEHGLDVKHILPDVHNVDEVIASDSVFSLLFSLGKMDAFLEAFIESDAIGQYGNNDVIADWIIRKPEHAPLLKFMFSHPDLTEETAQLLRWSAFRQAIERDIAETVKNQNPVIVGANFLGRGGNEYYTGAVALQNFSRIMDNDFGLSLTIPANRQVDRGAGYTGTLIWALADIITIGRADISDAKKKAVVRTVSKRLKEDFADAASWRRFVEKASSFGDNALDALSHRGGLNVTNNEAKKLLFVP